LSELEPITFHPRGKSRSPTGSQGTRSAAAAQTTFNRTELTLILAVYGRRVAAGEWRDYAIDMLSETATFSMFRRSSECPIYRVEKTPKLARKQGAYSVITATGLILKRGNDLKRVLAALEKPVRLVDH
jgi:hypothetical protein